MSAEERDFFSMVQALADDLQVVGAAAGVLHGSDVRQAYVGSTSVANPLPVNSDTLFQFGSTGKTMTATALVLLEAQGRVDLGTPVRSYVPEFSLPDSRVADSVTVLQLLNHTAGWDGEQLIDTGDGDDAISKFVATMSTLPQLSPPGTLASYNNASLVLAGRVIEKVTQLPFETAVRQLLLQPLGLNSTFYRPAEVMTHRFAVGHQPGPDGSPMVLPVWALPRSANPAGGACATLSDQLRWAQIHLGLAGSDVLPEDARSAMQQPTVRAEGSAMGDAIGIAWQLGVVGDVTTVRHGGATYGQHSAFLMVPEHEFAVIVMTNTGPAGVELCSRLTDWALEAELGASQAEPQLADAAACDDYAGTYSGSGYLLHITEHGGGLRLQADPPHLPELTLAPLAGTGDRYIVQGGPLNGSRGYFHRDDAGAVDGLHLAGRFAPRTAITHP